MPDEVKGTVLREKRIRDHKLAYNELITNFMFVNLKSALCVYEEYAKQLKSLKKLTYLH